KEDSLQWHAHSSWLRATFYGALIIHPKEGGNYPFPKPKREAPILAVPASTLPEALIISEKEYYLCICSYSKSNDTEQLLMYLMRTPSMVNQVTSTVLASKDMFSYKPCPADTTTVHVDSRRNQPSSSYQCWTKSAFLYSRPITNLRLLEQMPLTLNPSQHQSLCWDQAEQLMS
ncbi:hypothetical protein HAX54_036929, partial [Datura stramonium]|nr:hypothetical protein [Datura stramonium]